MAADVLESLGLGMDADRERLEDIIGQGQGSPSGHIPFTPRAKRVLQLALREALALGHNSIGTKHILLGLVREGEGAAAQALASMDVGSEPNPPASDPAVVPPPGQLRGKGRAH